jgi:hypothetical protein
MSVRFMVYEAMSVRFMGYDAMSVRFMWYDAMSVLFMGYDTMSVQFYGIWRNVGQQTGTTVSEEILSSSSEHTCTNVLGWY